MSESQPPAKKKKDIPISLMFAFVFSANWQMFA